MAAGRASEIDGRAPEAYERASEADGRLLGMEKDVRVLVRFYLPFTYYLRVIECCCCCC